uniref:Protein kinase domain-containing protein n=1 Tax=Solanum lycopersicum TaxID=4081 RepID=A0A3Q7ILW8_SOLLC
GGSPDRESVESGTKKSSISSGGRVQDRKEFLRRFVDSKSLIENLKTWYEELREEPPFDVPFELIDLQKFDYALEGVPFQQLIRMPRAIYDSASGAVEATAYLALEDFLHASVKSLWESFWGQDEPLPFCVSSIYNSNLRFYQAEKAIAKGRVGGLCATAIMLKNPKHPQGKWDDVLQLAILRPDIGNRATVENDYIGALQVLFATFHSITQYAGMSTNSVEDLAADHSSRLQARRIERQLWDSRSNGNGSFRLEQHSASHEIVEVHEESVGLVSEKSINLEVGSVLLLEDSNWQKGYQINEVLTDGEITYYIASPVEDPGKALFLYVGSHPSQLEPAWEDMKLWYQVQRQTKILKIMKQNGLSSKYLPQLSASGRIVHPGQCRRRNGGNCDYSWCGTPILVTTSVGITVADMVRVGQFGKDEAIRCCHDCLSALSAAASAGIRHGDLRPENVIFVTPGVGQPYFVLVGWGHALLEERDRPAINLHFSSTYALQEGKLCSASDAESLVYMLYFSSGGDMPDLDSVEGALQWRETSWSRRLIHQKLGDISTVLKAFADYVDSLCGTPYRMDYDIWLRRLERHIHGKEIETSN